MSYAQIDSPTRPRTRSLTEKARLNELGKNQQRRSYLDSIIRTELLKMETLLEDDRQIEFQGVVATLEKLFAEYLQCH